ncbi:MAG: peptide chain release factor N(5)-glutamine methyltransferase [Bacteroidota bacterium]
MSEQPKIIWTVVDIIKWGTDYFGSKGVDSPRLTIELLLSEVLQCTRLQLYLMHDRPLTQGELSILRETCTRRAKREPLQYILGKTGFYGLDFTVTPDVLIPRPETETLIDTVLKYCSTLSGPISIFDIGTGSGCIAITLAHHLRHRENVTIKAIDISQQALRIAQLNAQSHDVIIEFQCIDILKKNGSISGIIVSNPPYIGEDDYQGLEPELYFEPKIALTDHANGLRFYQHIAGLIGDKTNDIQSFFLEVGYGQMQDVENFFRPFTKQLSKVHDLSGIERVLWGETRPIL